MQTTINDLLKGKPTQIKDNNYLATKEYVQPFLDLMSKYTNNFKVKVILPSQITYDSDDKTDTKDITYNRVLIEAVLPKENTIDDHDEVIGFLYGLDIKTPIAKIYRGYLNRACTNLSVFNPAWIKVQEIKPLHKLNYKVDDLLNYTNDFDVKLKKLKSNYINRKDLKNELGKWIDYCLIGEYKHDDYNVKISPNLAIKGYKSLILDEYSPYFLQPDEDPSQFKIHEAMTQVITDDKKDIISHFEKTLMVNDMLNFN